VSPFEADWTNLTVEHVAAFLADAGDEGLTWEAKAGALHPDRILKAGSGFANSVGGDLILGAERGEDGSWDIVGMEFPGDEPATWLSSLITAGLRPVPTFDVKSWPLDGRRALAVVHFEPTPVPPCMTSRGLLFERTSGQTLPVTDPTVLSQLVALGESARVKAEQSSWEGLQLRPEQLGQADESHHVNVVLALAATGTRDAFSRRLFGRRFAEEDFLGVLRPRLPVGPHGFVRRPWNLQVSQSWLLAQIWGLDATWAVRVAWNGSATVAYATAFEATSVGEAARIIEIAWDAAAELLQTLDAAEPAYLATETMLRVGQGTRVGRWVDLSGSNEEQIGSMTREMRRSLGEPAWEDDT
jgi:hypothetical protein